MSVGRLLALGLNGIEYRRFAEAAAHPEQAQERLWETTYAALREAPYWRGKLAPRLEKNEVTDYDTYKGIFQADAARRVSSLSGEPILFWAQSAGTTNEPKLFPLTERYRRQFQRLNGPFLFSLLQRFAHFLEAPVLYFAGMNPQRKSPAGIDVGYISNFNYRRIAKPIRRMYAVPPDLLGDEDMFLRYAPAYAMSRDLSAIFAIAPNRVIVFAEALFANPSRLLAQLEGREKPPAGLPPIHTRPERLAHVRSLLEAGERRLSRYWPRLSFVCCWKSSVCGLQLPLLDRFVAQDVPIVDAIYSATEGWFTVPLGAPDVGGPLHLGAIICEFFPAGASPDRALLKPWELEVGAEYEIVVTNLMGLVRYRLWDIVRCVGFHGRAPMLEFVQKAGAELLVGLCRFSEAQLVRASRHLRPSGPWVFGVNATGDQLVLFHSEPTDLSAVLASIERDLCDLNSDFAHELAIGAARRVAAVRLPPTHPAFAPPKHAQAKPTCFTNRSF